MTRDPIATLTELLDKGGTQDDILGVIAELLERNKQQGQVSVPSVVWAFLLTLVLAILKTAGVIGLSWFWVFLPVLMEVLMVAVFGLLVMGLRSQLKSTQAPVTVDREG